LRTKAETGTVKGLPGAVSVEGPLELARSCEYEVLVEATLANAEGAQPGLDCVRAALMNGRCAVLANKGPLVKDFAGLHQLAAEHGGAARSRIAYSATVCGGLPVLNVGCRDLPGASITKLEGVFNSTTNYILAQMGAGGTYESALAEAQRLNIAERDPSLDVDGWDTAFKLLILANAVLRVPTVLEDISVQGVREVTPEMIKEAEARGEVYKLVATAQEQQQANGDPRYKFEVAPRCVPASSFIGGIDGWEMGVVIHSDLWERVFLKIDEPSVVPTSAAVLRDIIRLAAPEALV